MSIFYSLNRDRVDFYAVKMQPLGCSVIGSRDTWLFLRLWTDSEKKTNFLINF